MIGELTVRRMMALSRHWAKHPPLHITVSQLFASAPASGGAKPVGTADVSELLGMLPEVRR